MDQDQNQNDEPEEVFNNKSMADTRFEELEIVLGKPYLYRHQSSCDHLFIFNDVRLKDSTDLTSSNFYPLNIFQNKIKRKRCDGCFLHFSK